MSIKVNRSPFRNYKGISLFMAHVNGVRNLIVKVDLNKIHVFPEHYQNKLKTDEAVGRMGRRLVAYGDGFNNLTYNLGYWLWNEHGLTVYDNRIGGKEALSGPQTAFMMCEGGEFPFIGLINDNLDAKIFYAFGAPRIIRPGGEVVSDLLSVDPGTGRALISEICGDLRQVIGIPKRHDFPSDPAAKNGRVFPLAQYFIRLFTKKDRNGNIIRINPDNESREIFSRAISGELTRINLKEIDPEKDNIGITKDKLIDTKDSDRVLSGYEYVDRIEGLIVGQFAIKDGELFIRFKKPRFNHSVVCTVQDRPDILLFVKQIDEGYRSGDIMLPKRNGFSFPESARIIHDICRQGLKLDVDQALEMTEGGCPRFCIPERDYFIGSYKSNERHSPWVSLMGFFDKSEIIR